MTRILVVDDSAFMRGIIRKVIEDNAPAEAIEILEANNGQEALDGLQSGPIDMVLVDWNMPVLDGLDFVKRARADGRELPIIMVTAVTDRMKVFEAAKAGVSGYIEKPVRSSELWAMIKECME